MSDPLAKIRRSTHTKLTDAFGQWVYRPRLRGDAVLSAPPGMHFFERSRDDLTVLSARGDDGFVHLELLDAGTGGVKHCVERPSVDPYDVFWDCAGDTLLLAVSEARGRTLLEVITLATRNSRTLAHAGEVCFVGFLSNGQYAVVSERVRGAAQTRVFNVERAKSLRTWPRAVSSLSSGAIALSHVDNGVMLWCPLDGEEIAVIANTPELTWHPRAPLALHPDEATLAGVDAQGRVCCVDASGARRWSSPWPFANRASERSSLRWAHAGRTLYVVDGDDAASLRGDDGRPIARFVGGVAPSATDDTSLTALKHGFQHASTGSDLSAASAEESFASVVSLALSVDGATVVSLTTDRRMRLWRAGEGQGWSCLSDSLAVAFIDATTLVSCRRFGGATIVSAETGDELRYIALNGEFWWVNDLAVTPDGSLGLITAHESDSGETRLVALDLRRDLALWQRVFPSGSEARRARGVGPREVTVSRAWGWVSQLAVQDGETVDEANVFGRFVREDGDFFFLNNGRRALCVGGGGGPLRLIEMMSGQVLWKRSDPGCDPSLVAVSPNGRWFTLALRHPKQGMVQIHEIETGDMIDEIDLRAVHDMPNRIVFSADNRALVIGTTRGAVLRFECIGLADATDDASEDL